MTKQVRRSQAVVPVIAKGSRFLVIKRGPDVILPGYWCPPSGRVEPEESQEQAVVREVAEELGLGAKPVRKVWECPTDDGEFILHWWIAEVDYYDPSPNKAEVADVRWVTPEEFLELTPTFEGDRRFFESVLPRLAPR